MDSKIAADGAGLKPRRDRKFVRAASVVLLCAIVSALWALRELVATKSQNHETIHWSTMFFVAAGVAVLLALIAKVLMMVHQEREHVAFEELLQRERERGLKV